MEEVQMVRVQFKFAMLAAAMVAAAAWSGPTPADAKSNTGAIIGGLIVGAAVGAAVSSEINHSKKVYVAQPPAPQPWSKVFSPKPGVLCYPAQQACYNSAGAFSGYWTLQVYGR
jgi:hypothetical protein